MWRNGDIGFNSYGGWEFTEQKSDPMIAFKTRACHRHSSSTATTPKPAITPAMDSR